MQSVSRVFRKHYLLILVIFIVVVLLGGYVAGYRPGPGLTIVKVGTLTVTGIPAGTTVYTDLSSRGTAKSTYLSAALVPGTHTVIVDVPNDEPFQALVTIVSNQTTTISPILVSKKPGQVDLTTAEQSAAKSALAAAIVPTESAPLAFGCANVYVSDNRVIAAAATSSPDCATPPDYLCTDGSCEPTIIYSPNAPIHSLVAFPGRSDAFIIATGEWVYAIGLDPRVPYQFFAPLMHGFAPTVADGTSTSTIYVQDQNSVLGVSF